MAEESEAIMTCDIILCSVGGQGGLSASIILARAAMAAGFQVKQSEIHGMSQRGGEVLAHLRIADKEIYSPTISKGKADIVFAFESNGTIVSATAPVLNIPNYPDLEIVLAEIRKIPRSRLIDAEDIARQAGNVRTANLVLIGAAMDLLPVSPNAIEKEIIELFSRKGELVIQANLKAFEAGRALYHG